MSKILDRKQRRAKRNRDGLGELVPMLCPKCKVRYEEVPSDLSLLWCSRCIQLVNPESTKL